MHLCVIAEEPETPVRLNVQVFLASFMGPWRAAARGVAIEFLRFLVAGWGEKDHCPTPRDWKAEDQISYWKEESAICRARLREAYSCAAELEFLQKHHQSCVGAAEGILLVLTSVILGAFGSWVIFGYLRRPTSGIVVAEIETPRKGDWQEAAKSTLDGADELAAARQRARSLRG